MHIVRAFRILGDGDRGNICCKLWVVQTSQAIVKIKERVKWVEFAKSEALV